MTKAYLEGLEKNAANHVPLTPLSFLNRTAVVYPDRTAILHGAHKTSYREMRARCRRLASALIARGIERNDTVAIMAPNIPAFVEASFGVPMAGAVLNAINTRLDPEAVAFILGHGEAKLVLVDRELGDVVAQACAQMKNPPAIIDIDDPLATSGTLIGEQEYEDLLASGDPEFAGLMPGDEWDAIALNYTSGTTGDPKGVVYSHRGAYLNAMGNSVTWAMPHFPVYLWTLPMFHCNGWCFPWTITAMAGTHVCLRRVEGPAILESIAQNGITHLCGAPIVMSMMAAVPEDQRPSWTQHVKMMTAGAAPPAAVIAGMDDLEIEVTHVYGLTEVYGPCVICAWHPEWSDRPPAEQARIKSRQGVAYEVQEGIMVADPQSLEPVPWDGETMGEIMMRGNVMMKGYLKNPTTSDAAFAGGWYHTGDLAVQHPDGYVEIKDRSKDIIISGGENISSIEIEDVLYAHPAVATAAVVARPDAKWGEAPCAFIELKVGKAADEAELIAHCRSHLAHFKCPRTIIFEEIPKTSTGKIQKFALREKVRSL
ncbi:MAG: fatty-acyl-CoA synthase [Halocynthiibacter sp.]|jgi:fatty-acyl-CoA synthase